MGRNKSSTQKYRKRRKKERANRVIKKRMIAEDEFAQRIREEPSLERYINQVEEVERT